jgi:hypothetical protein
VHQKFVDKSSSHWKEAALLPLPWLQGRIGAFDHTFLLCRGGMKGSISIFKILHGSHPNLVDSAGVVVEFFSQAGVNSPGDEDPLDQAVI